MAPFYADLDRAFPRTRHGHLRLAPVPMTFGLALVNAAIFAAGYYAPDTGVLHNIKNWFPLDPELVWGGEWWRLVTHCFVHGDLDHLTSNLLGLFLFVYWVEPAIGRTRFLFMYFATGIAGGLASLIAEPMLSLGASGAIYGIAGVYLSLLWRSRGSWFRPFAPLQRWFWTLSTLWFISGNWNDPQVDYLGHFAGLAIGVWFGCALPVRAWAPRRVTRGLRLCHTGLATSLVIAIILASCAFWQPGYWYAHAEKAVERGDWSMAETCLQVLERCAISAIYSDAYALASAADLYQDHYNNNHARVLLERSVPALESAWPYVELGYAQAYYEPYMEREALASYREALSWEPDYVPALFGIADIKNRAVDSTLHDPRGARDLAKKAVIADHGSEPLALLVLAEAQYGCGNTEEAIRLLERALRLRPKNPGLYRDTLSEIKCAASDSLAGSTRVLRPKRAGCPGGGSQR